jgi:acyl carrier protein
LIDDSAIRGILAEHGQLAIDVASLTADDNLYAAGLTSHASINVMLALEDEFDVEFGQELIRRSTFESISAIRQALTVTTASQSA